MKRRGRAKARPSERNPGAGITGFWCATSGLQNAKDTPMLSINNIEVVYDNIILVLRGVSLEAKPGSLTTLLRGNVAGKTPTLQAECAVVRTEGGTLTKGSITLDGKRIDGMPAFDVTK